MVRDCAGTLVTSRRPVVVVGTGASITVMNELRRFRITFWYRLRRLLSGLSEPPSGRRSSEPLDCSIASRIASASNRRTFARVSRRFSGSILPALTFGITANWNVRVSVISRTSFLIDQPSLTKRLAR